MSAPTKHTVCPRCYGFDHSVPNCPYPSKYEGCKHCGENKHTGTRCEYDKKQKCRLCTTFNYKITTAHSIVACKYISNREVVISKFRKGVSSCPHCSESLTADWEACPHCGMRFHMDCKLEHKKNCNNDEEEAPIVNGKCWIASVNEEKLRLYKEAGKTEKAPRTPPPESKCIVCKSGAVRSGWTICPYCKTRLHLRKQCFSAHCSDCPLKEEDETEEEQEEEEEESNNNNTSPPTGPTCVYCPDPRVRTGWSSCSECKKPCHILCIQEHAKLHWIAEEKKREHEVKDKEQKEAPIINLPAAAPVPVIERKEDLIEEFLARDKDCVTVQEANVVVIGKYKKVKLPGQGIHDRSSFLAAVMRAGQSNCYYLHPNRKSSMILDEKNENLLNFMAQIPKVKFAYEGPNGNNMEGEDYPDGEELTKELTIATASYLCLRLIVIDELTGEKYNLLDPKLHYLPSVFVKKDNNGYHAMIVHVYMVKENRLLPIASDEPRRTLSGKAPPPTAEKTPVMSVESKEEEEEEKKVVPMEIENKYEEKQVPLDLDAMLDDLELSSDKKARFRKAVENAKNRNHLITALPQFSNFAFDLWTVAHGRCTLEWWEQNYTRVKNNMDQGFLAEAKDQPSPAPSPSPIQPPVASASPIPINNNNQQANKRLSVASIDTPVVINNNLVESKNNNNNNNSRKRPSPTPVEPSSSDSSPLKRQAVIVKGAAAPPTTTIHFRRPVEIMGSLDQAPSSSSSSSNSVTDHSILNSQENNNNMEVEEEPSDPRLSQYDYSGLIHTPIARRPQQLSQELDNFSLKPLVEYDSKRLDAPLMGEYKPTQVDNSMIQDDIDNQTIMTLCQIGGGDRASSVLPRHFFTRLGSVAPIHSNQSLADGMMTVRENSPNPSGLHMFSPPTSSAFVDSQDLQSTGEQKTTQDPPITEESVQKLKQLVQSTSSFHETLENIVKTYQPALPVNGKLCFNLNIGNELIAIQTVIPVRLNDSQRFQFAAVIHWVKLICEHLLLPYYRKNVFTFISKMIAEDRTFDNYYLGMIHDFNQRFVRLGLFHFVCRDALFQYLRQ